MVKYFRMCLTTIDYFFSTPVEMVTSSDRKSKANIGIDQMRKEECVAMKKCESGFWDTQVR